MSTDTSTAGLCVYGVVKVRTIPAIMAVGIEGRSVRAVESAPLATLVSDAPLGLLNASRRNLMMQVVNDELGPGLRLTYVGPLPPYRFVGTAVGAGSAARA